MINIVVDYNLDKELVIKSDETSDSELNTHLLITQYILLDAENLLSNNPDTFSHLHQDPFFLFYIAYDFHLAK
jgi:hypothetical protein